MIGVTTLALTCLLLLGAGYAVLTALLFVPSLAPAAREAWPILLTETLIVGVVAGAFWIGGWVLALVLFALAWRCGYEAAKVAFRRWSGDPPPAIGIGGLIAGLGGVASLLPMAFLATALFLTWLVCIFLWIGNRLQNEDEARMAVEIAVFPGLPLILFTAAGLQGGFGAWLLVAFLLVETFDSYALLGGKLFGRTPAFPVLSPKKTVEGLGIGAAMLMLTAALAGAILAGAPLAQSGTVALFVGVLTVAGDLAASALKRRSGVKDFPPVLRLQGGLLDITDAWIAAGAGLVVVVALFG